MNENMDLDLYLLTLHTDLYDDVRGAGKDSDE
jgi:hypothetical protein